MSFIAKRASRSHTIHVDAPVGQAFALFDPIAERLWVNGWDPEIVHPPSQEIAPGTVFLTRAPDEPATIWRVESCDRERFYARYLRITPESRLGDVEVQCRPVDDQRTAVVVTYSFTALSPEGNQWVERFTEECYRAFIDSWEKEIRRYLSGRSS